MKVSLYFDVSVSDENKNKFMEYANDTRGWVSMGFVFKEIASKSKPCITVFFKTNKELQKIFENVDKHYFETHLAGLSVTDRTNPSDIKLYINVENWNKPPPKGIIKDLQLYREYLTQHELGHAIGKDHPSKDLGEFCNPMTQQSKPQQCKPNPWITGINKN